MAGHVLGFLGDAQRRACNAARASRTAAQVQHPAHRSASRPVPEGKAARSAGAQKTRATLYRVYPFLRMHLSRVVYKSALGGS